MPYFYSPLYVDRAGQEVKIIRELSETERDPEVGRMFVVEFADGVRLDVFEDEIMSTPSKIAETYFTRSKDLKK